ncbi:MAG: hypothetical protein MJA27_17085 [Pseudanabaenales cyanobacterium]|nr:hypothetical protein [Pseudanabaenales cyanobacterium]
MPFLIANGTVAGLDNLVDEMGQRFAQQPNRGRAPILRLLVKRFGSVSFTLLYWLASSETKPALFFGKPPWVVTRPAYPGGQSAQFETRPAYLWGAVSPV